jgi:hypothetical protein
VRADGSVVVAWAAQRASDAVIESEVRSAAGSWSATSLVSGTGLLAAWPVALGADGAGTVLAAWGQTNPSRLQSITVATLPVGGSWSAPAQLATPVQSSLRQVVIAENAAGATVVGWVRVAGDLYGDVATRSAGGTFRPAVTIAHGGLRPLQNQIHYFRVGIDATGRAVSTWNTLATYASAQNPDRSWLAATYFSPYTRVGDLAAATDVTGTTTSLWNAFGQIRISSIAPGGAWTPEQAVLSGSNPMDLSLAANGTTLYGAWYESSAATVTAATHTAAGWSTPVAITRLGSSGWFAALAIAPSLTGALVAWISGTTSTGQVSVSLAS